MGKLRVNSATGKNPCRGLGLEGKTLVARVTILLLIITSIISPGTQAPALAQDSGAYNERILSRHLPISASFLNESALVDLLDELLSSLEKRNETELADIVGDLKNYVETGNETGFAEKRDELRNLLEKNPNILVKLDEETIRQLLSLASMNLTMTDEGVVGFLDPEVYSGLEEYIDRILSSYEGREALGQPGSILVEAEPPLNIIEKIPEPPGDMVPDIYLNAGERVETVDSGLAPLTVLALFTIAGYSAYRVRRYILHGLSRARRALLSVIAERRIRQSIGTAGSPRDAIVSCYRSVTELMAKLGYSKHEWETHREYYDKVRGLPFSSALQEITKLYEKAMFSPAPVTWEEASRCLVLSSRVGKVDHS